MPYLRAELRKQPSALLTTSAEAKPPKPRARHRTCRSGLRRAVPVTRSMSCARSAAPGVGGTSPVAQRQHGGGHVQRGRP